MREKDQEIKYYKKNRGGSFNSAEENVMDDFDDDEDNGEDELDEQYPIQDLLNQNSHH